MISYGVDTRDWPRSPHGKLVCPVCGGSGWPGGSWLRKHKHHEQMPCGRYVPVASVAGHSNRCKECKTLEEED